MLRTRSTVGIGAFIFISSGQLFWIVSIAFAADSDEPTNQPTTDAEGPTKPPEELISEEPTPAGLHLGMFVDAYGSWQTGDEGTLATLSNHRLFSGQGANLRSENGFSLAFLGADANYDAGNIGAKTSLRFGQAATIYHYKSEGATDLDFGVNNIYEAFAFFRPDENLEIDAGLFLSPFGVEVMESWRNPNYTRGAVGNYAQPNWHTGLRVQWQLNKSFGAQGFVANGSNVVSETQENSGLDQHSTGGVQLTLSPNDYLSFALGGMLAFDREDNADGGFDTFGDFVTSLQLGALTASVNADVIATKDGAPNGNDRYCFGMAVSAGYSLNDNWGLGARGEYLRDDANYDGSSGEWELVTGTLTLDFRVNPLSKKTKPDESLFIVRWENRVEQSNQDIYGRDSQGTEDVADDLYTDTWFQSVVGVVFTTEP